MNNANTDGADLHDQQNQGDDQYSDRGSDKEVTRNKDKSVPMRVLRPDEVSREVAVANDKLRNSKNKRKHEAGMKWLEGCVEKVAEVEEEKKKKYIELLLHGEGIAKAEKTLNLTSDQGVGIVSLYALNKITIK